MRYTALISSGLDSPVACHMMLSKGCDIIAVHMEMRPGMDEKTSMKVRTIIRRLQKIHGKRIGLYTIPYGDIMREALNNADKRYSCIICKRLMYHIARQIGKKESCQGILTGDSIGQVASQTLDNMRAISDRIETIFMRPLIGLDKDTIVKIAKEIGTYDISIQKESDCPFVPVKPITHAKPDIVESLDIDMETMARKAAKAADIEYVD